MGTTELIAVLQQGFSSFVIRWHKVRVPTVLFIGSVGVLGVGVGLWQLRQLSKQDLFGSCPDQPSSGESVASRIETESNVAREATVFVDVSGAVNFPGVYEVPTSSRVNTVISLAGGFSAVANKQFIHTVLNLAKPVSDASKIYVPLESENFEGRLAVTDVPTKDANEKQVSTKVSLNTASQEALDALPGIGEKRAQDIVAGRPYQSVDELVEREIVSESLFKQIEKLVDL